MIRLIAFGKGEPSAWAAEYTSSFGQVFGVILYYGMLISISASLIKYITGDNTLY